MRSGGFPWGARPNSHLLDKGRASRTRFRSVFTFTGFGKCAECAKTKKPRGKSDVRSDAPRVTSMCPDQVCSRFPTLSTNQKLYENTLLPWIRRYRAYTDGNATSSRDALSAPRYYYFWYRRAHLYLQWCDLVRARADRHRSSGGRRCTSAHLGSGRSRGTGRAGISGRANISRILSGSLGRWRRKYIGFIAMGRFAYTTPARLPGACATRGGMDRQHNERGRGGPKLPPSL